jgi:hypothetical protein
MKDPEDDPPWGLTDIVFLGVAILFAIALLVYG